MKTFIHFGLFFCAFFFASTMSIFAQGSITPTGTPGATMKSLDQIEPRTPISSLPFPISTGGSYYLTTNLTWSTGAAGITVSADNVTIDLNGFALLGGGGTNIPAITVSSSAQSFCVRNGTISGWSGNGITGANVNGAIYDKLRLINNTGIGLLAGAGCNIRQCVANSQQGVNPGIQTGECCTITNCTFFANSGDGIHTSFNCTIVNCTAAENHANGIHTNDFCSIADSTSTSNFSAGPDGFGILTGVGAKVTNCVVGSNNKSGISVGLGSTVQGCAVRGNAINGITFTNNCFISGNGCDTNNTVGTGTNAGIFTAGNGNTMDSNSSTSNGNGIGISMTGSHNIMTRNSCTGNGAGNYQVGVSNAYGPIVDMSAGGPIASGANPWSNWIH